jgi:hypothetical protein
LDTEDIVSNPAAQYNIGKVAEAFCAYTNFSAEK